MMKKEEKGSNDSWHFKIEWSIITEKKINIKKCCGNYSCPKNFNFPGKLRTDC